MSIAQHLSTHFYLKRRGLAKERNCNFPPQVRHIFLKSVLRGWGEEWAGVLNAHRWIACTQLRLQFELLQKTNQPSIAMRVEN